MKVQIYGAGIGGSFLYHLLNKEGFEVKIFERRKAPSCHCAWGINKKSKKLYRKISVSLDEFVISKPEYAVVNNKIWVRCRDFVIFDRVKLLSFLWKEMNFGKVERPEVVIDATGTERAVLPKINQDSLWPTFQKRVRAKNLEENVYITLGKTGYGWIFPLSEREFHIGAGARDKGEALSLLSTLEKTFKPEVVREICSCVSRVRMLSPARCRPIARKNIYGIGEAVGCVNSLGEGNYPSLKSAWIFYTCLANGKLKEYEKILLRKMKDIHLHQEFLSNLIEGKLAHALIYFLLSLFTPAESFFYAGAELLRIYKNFCRNP